MFHLGILVVVSVVFWVVVVVVGVGVVAFFMFVFLVVVGLHRCAVTWFMVGLGSL